MLELVQMLPKIIKDSKKRVQDALDSQITLKLQTNEIIYPSARFGNMFHSNSADIADKGHLGGGANSGLSRISTS